MSAARRSETVSWVGSAIADARVRAGLTQEGLAIRLNRCQSYVAKIEGGVRGVGVREFLWIVHCLGENPLQLLSQLYSQDDFRDLENRPVRSKRKR